MKVPRTAWRVNFTDTRGGKAVAGKPELDPADPASAGLRPAAEVFDAATEMIAQHGKAAVFREQTRGRKDAGCAASVLVVGSLVEEVLEVYRCTSSIAVLYQCLHVSHGLVPALASADSEVALGESGIEYLARHGVYTLCHDAFDHNRYPQLPHLSVSRLSGSKAGGQPLSKALRPPHIPSASTSIRYTGYWASPFLSLVGALADLM